MSQQIWETLGEEVSWEELSKDFQLSFEGLVKDGGDETPHGLKVKEYLANQQTKQIQSVTFSDSASVSDETPKTKVKA